MRVYVDDDVASAGAHAAGLVDSSVIFISHALSARRLSTVFLIRASSEQGMKQSGWNYSLLYCVFILFRLTALLRFFSSALFAVAVFCGSGSFDTADRSVAEECQYLADQCGTFVGVKNTFEGESEYYGSGGADRMPWLP